MSEVIMILSLGFAIQNLVSLKRNSQYFVIGRSNIKSLVKKRVMTLNHFENSLVSDVGLGYYNASIDALGLIIDEITTKWARKKKNPRNNSQHTLSCLCFLKREMPKQR